MGKSIEKVRFCKLSEKIITDEPETFTKLVSKPKYFCRKCFRVSANKDNLCKPQKLKDFTSSKGKKDES